MDKTANVFTEGSMITGLSVIEYEGALWIATGWLEHNSKPVRRPIRLIRLSGLDYQVLDPRIQRADYLVTSPIPRSVLDGTASAEASTGFVVLDMPKLELPISTKH